MWWTRLKALILKELLAVLRDPRARIILIVPPVIQLVVFSYAATLEVRNVDVIVLNRDAGRWGYELVQRIEGSPTFRKVSFTRSPEALHEAVDRQNVLAAIQISPTFSRDIEARPADGCAGHSRRAPLECLADRRRLSQSDRRRPVGGHAGGAARRIVGRRCRAAQLVQPEPDLSMVHGSEPHRKHRASDRAHRHRPVDCPGAGARHLRSADGLAPQDA